MRLHNHRDTSGLVSESRLRQREVETNLMLESRRLDVGLNFLFAIFLSLSRQCQLGAICVRLQIPHPFRQQETW